jgi:hypothetical protein
VGLLDVEYVDVCVLLAVPGGGEVFSWAIVRSWARSVVGFVQFRPLGALGVPGVLGGV